MEQATGLSRATDCVNKFWLISIMLLQLRAKRASFLEQSCKVAFCWLSVLFESPVKPNGRTITYYLNLFPDTENTLKHEEVAAILLTTLLLVMFFNRVDSESVANH